MNRREALVAFIAVGGAVSVSSASSAQELKVWRVGFLSLASSDAHSGVVLVASLRELGYVEGRNVVFEWRFADGSFERLPGLAAELVQSKVDVIVAVASAAIGAAKKATTTIPIVMATTGDPVGSGFVKSLARPGGNITGLSNMGGETGAKLVELLLSMVPKATRVGVLVTPTSTTYRAILESVQAGAKKAGLTIVVAEASTPHEIDSAFSLMAREKVGAVIVGSSPFFALHVPKIVDLANNHRIPSIFGSRNYVDAGGLMSYGSDRTEHFRRAAAYVDRIFRGAKPADLPVEQPVKIELVVNLKTAKTLRLSIPPEIMLRAETVK